jgi:hypothetical protein
LTLVTWITTITTTTTDTILQVFILADVDFCTCRTCHIASISDLHPIILTATMIITMDPITAPTTDPITTRTVTTITDRPTAITAITDDKIFWSFLSTLNCYKGKTLVKTCADGYEFDSKIPICVAPGYAQC